ncbi:Hint domain-containing protein [Paracoccus sp. ME4]|uniref:Hint domain-containing protein n=1 Tax=Paracoccus sp. ME4 TaxID=3138066 RepID=UPI00398B2014
MTSPISLTFTGNNTTSINFPLNLGSLLTNQTGPLTGDDQNGNGFIQRGETIDHNGPGGPVPNLLDPVPDLSNAQVQGVGLLGGLVSGIVVRYPVILVTSGGSQYLIYPGGTPDLLTLITGAVNTNIIFYPNGQIGPGGGFQPCFARGTMIRTDRGDVAIEDLAEGDMVLTADRGFQPLRWIGSRSLSAQDLADTPSIRPIRIAKGALGMGTPAADLVVSPQHRVLARSAIAQRMFGTDEVLVAAKQLCLLDGIDVASDMDTVEYFHMLFDQHEVVVSNGAETEALYTGAEALRGVEAAALEEILALFPQIRDYSYVPEAARVLASGRMGRKLAVRHARSGKALI